MQRTKIEYADYVWNPIKGLCPVECHYCYARRIYQRFRLNPEIRLDLDELMMDFPKKPSRIFVCSTFELFHPLADPYRNNVFRHIGLEPQHIFIVLTKMPERIDRPMPDNVWLGVSVTDRSDLHRIDVLYAKQTGLKFKFVSFEPLFADNLGSPDGLFRRLNWVIVGRLTGHGHKFDPNKRAIKNIIRAARLWGAPVFLKNNLREIWGELLIQEFPAISSPPQARGEFG